MAQNPPFRRVLIANRGEIAVRISRGLRELGIESVAVHSDVDARCAHVLHADHAIPLGGNTAAESYLDFDKILAACKRSGAEAIHPGYGFLSENSAFARAVRDAGLVFIGPKPEAMDRLGSKKAAREEAAAAGVPTTPGTEQDVGDKGLIEVAKKIGMPVMVKASAGGGGRGMRLVEREQDLAEALAAGRREALASFGDDRMIVERAVFPARHIEIQLIGDRHGNVVSLHERECSVQRRHQKVLEESPSAVVDEALRQRMGECAIALAKRVGYDNAGTAEFLLDDQGRFYFLEVNTRLQVEHPVTEFITGIDLVQQQIHIAAGEKLALRQRDIELKGHAIECRINAEDPDHNFKPSPGTIRTFVAPAGPGVRWDSHIYQGYTVPPHYDSMVGKLIIHRHTRKQAIAVARRALQELTLEGITTTASLFLRILDHSDFRAGEVDTGFIDRYFSPR